MLLIASKRFVITLHIEIHDDRNNPANNLEEANVRNSQRLSCIGYHPSSEEIPHSQATLQ